jgi:hypothetical protein
MVQISPLVLAYSMARLDQLLVCTTHPILSVMLEGLEAGIMEV